MIRLIYKFLLFWTRFKLAVFADANPHYRMHLRNLEVRYLRALYKKEFGL